MSKSNNSKIIVVRESRTERKTAPVVRLNVTAPPNQKKANRKRRRNGTLKIGSNPYASQWLKSLNNPFDNLPPRLGLGCMLPTVVETAYVRNMFATNADGSFQFWLNPNKVVGAASSSDGGFVMIDTAGETITPIFTTSQVAPDNQVAMIASGDGFRVLSGGVRIFCLGPQSSAPGILGSQVYARDIAGNIPNCTNATSKKSVNTLIKFPNMDITKGTDPLTVVWRPASIVNVENFTTGNIVYNADMQVPAINIVGKALSGGAATNVYYEAVVHYEVYNTTGGVTGGTSGESQENSNVGYETMGGLWNSLKAGLLPASQSVVEYATLQTQSLAAQALSMGTSYAIRNVAQRYGNRIKL